MFSKRRNACVKKYMDFQFVEFTMIKEWRAFKCEIWYKMYKIVENLVFVENSNFVKGSTEAVVCRSSGIMLVKSRGGVLL